MKFGEIVTGISLLLSCGMMACSESSSTEPSLEEILAEYSVAYEFNDPTNVGLDFFGKNNAIQDKSMPAVVVENGSLVLDGSSGLRIPLSADFKNQSFVVETRFMPTKPSKLGNIFSADPPGGGYDGWMVRMEDSAVTFHIRGGSDDWKDFSAGTISMNEWHVIRVKLSYTAAENLTVEAYKLEITLDGKNCVSEILYNTASNLKYDLGIGYDPHHQSQYQDRFFTGKIDYIRYGKI
ncbi:MAG: hypothetical protein J6W51_04450 [Fibrobacter sp.]|nr:hypothetical protein [Fibrobacter sp.]